MIFMIIPLMMIVWLPESPRYLILAGMEHEAKNVLSALNEMSPEDEDIHREFLMVKHTLLHMVTGGYREAFRQGEHRYLQRTILAVLLQIMQQFTGINLFMQYLGSMFFAELQFPQRMSLLLAGACSTEFFLASLIAVIGIDRFWGRRTLTIFGAAGMSVCLIALCILDSIGTKTAHHVMAGFLFLYCTLFSLGWQGMSWLWAVELIPLSARGPANALASAANWLANFIVVLVDPILFLNTGYHTYIVFAVCNFCIVPTIYFFYRETGYRSLEEVDVIFSEASKAGNPWFSAVRTARQEPLWFDRHGRKSDGYSSEDGTVKDEKDKDDVRDSDASKWASYCRARETSTGSSDSSEMSDKVPVMRATPVTALPHYGARRLSYESAASPPPDFSVSKHV